MLTGPLPFTVQAATCEDDRVVVEGTSAGTRINGEEYRHTYVFILQICNGKIASVAEHCNAITSQDKLVPLMARAAVIREVGQ